MAEVLVVGAGVGGLAVASRLCAAGHAVTVFEQAPEVGGKLGLLADRGYRWDTGPSLVTLPHLLEDTLAASGAALADHLGLVPLEPLARYRFADGTRLDASSDRQIMHARLSAALGRAAADDWERFLQRAERMWEAAREPFLERPLHGPASLARLALRARDVATIAPHRTLRQLAEQLLGDPRLRMLVDRYATYSGSDPRRAPATLATIPFVEQRYGGWYVAGGLRRIAEVLAERVRAGGGIVRCGADVVAVRLERGRAAGVRLADGEEHDADVVVANADAAHLYGDLLPPTVARRTRRRLARTQPSFSGFVLLLGVREAARDHAHHTVLFPADYDAEFDALFGNRPRPVEDPTIYVSAPHDPTVAPPGRQAWFVLVNAPRHGQGGLDWDRTGLADGYAEHLLDLLAARGVDVRERVEVRHVLSPADLERRTRAVGGAIYGTSSNGPRAAFLRPANRSPVPGLFLTGGSAHPGGGLPLVLLSARITAGLVGAA
jgi:phytoene desaturase